MVVKWKGAMRKSLTKIEIALEDRREKKVRLVG